MRLSGLALALAGIFAGTAMGQTPTVTGLLNNYSNTLPGLPNYGIAEGSIFVIYGTNFSSTQSPLQSPPPATLSGVTINVTVGTTVTHPLFYYLYPTQIAAVLPSATPVGTGTITVTTSAGTSTGFPIQVVASDFGLLTSNNGSGPAQGYDASIDASNQYVLFNFSEAANPGDILELWGTGLGPVANDATGVAVAPTPQVFIGGIAATVQYAGRSGFTGLDQINVVVPAGITGCYVSVVVQTGTYVSNFGTLPVAASGRTCTDANSPLTASLLDQLFSTGSLSVGTVSVSQLTLPGETVDGVTVGGTTIDAGSASFSKITSAQYNQGAFAAALGGFSSIGSCFVDFFTTTNTSITTLPLAFQFTSLNAGPAIDINGPDGTLAMPLTTTNGVYNYSTSGLTDFIPAAGGAFTFSGTGGPDVGAFTTPTIQLAAPVTFTNASSISPVTRSNGLTVNWTGGQTGSYVGITGFSLAAESTAANSYLVGFFSCRAPASAGTFTVPPSVLLSVPVSSSITEDGVTVSAGFLLLSNLSAPATFTATGIDLGLVDAGVEEFLFVTYQ
ncbi:MAG TPA: hypothetical protein VMQ86_10780 [Bryobacteraceae bacterium]|jgi:uncharacterized protein (TIGR03437 family)|nr:hypothetical protein [Bryobacteraceae bacterium]